ncbi:hypothetical protein OG21DRAFT_706523 [Imleria badia]|nr:hypothetical protein OG21DRAFT_706523 [Imleria badia]
MKSSRGDYHRYKYGYNAGNGGPTREREGMRANALANCTATLRDGTSLNYVSCYSGISRHGPCHSYPCSTLRPLVTWPRPTPTGVCRMSLALRLERQITKARRKRDESSGV